VDGICRGRALWRSRAAEVAHGVWNFVSFFVVILVIFIFCYWRIIVTIRRQASDRIFHFRKIYFSYCSLLSEERARKLL